MFVKKQRKPNRLRYYDYSKDGIYFITICAARRNEFLGKIVNGKMILNQKGAIAEKCWREIPLHFPTATLDAYVLMPDHIHGIISIDNRLETPAPPLTAPFSYPRTKMLIPKIIQQYKASVTRKIRAGLRDYSFEWQRSYHDHIVRNGQALGNIRQYIVDNPIKWQNEARKRNDKGKNYGWVKKTLGCAQRAR
jgi:REP element-mobilizing transposase RayT